MRVIVAFEKAWRVRHIGHLDLMRAMQRALRRSGLPVRYSQGFNPHVRLSFASPLPVGTSGAEELMDVALAEPVEAAHFAAMLAAALPDSLPLVEVRLVEDGHPALMAQLRTASYEALLPLCEASRAMADAIPALLARAEIIAVRRTKSGERPCDIRQMLHELSQAGRPDARCLRFRLSLTERETLRPDLLLDQLAAQAGVSPPEAFLRRLRLYAERDGRPVPLMER